MSMEKGLKLMGKNFQITMLTTSKIIAYFRPDVQPHVANTLF